LKRQEHELRSETELLNLLDEVLKDPLEKEKKFSQVIEEQGIEGMQLMDNRTAQIIESYLFYKSSPQSAFDNRAWFESVIMLNAILEVRLF